MGSIYRKGRDGYFYYQTYVFNSDSGKKDKRIFHSLGTRDETIALLKKIELDKKYEQKHFNKEKSLFNNWLVFPTLLFIVSIIVFLFLKEGINGKKNNKNSMKYIDSIENSFIETENIGISDKNTDGKISEAKEVANLNPINERNEIKLSKNKLVDINNYTIESIRRLSGAFQQGEIHLTIKNEHNSESLLMLCNKLRDEHKEFSNLLICIYDSSKNGKKMATNRTDDLTTREMQEVWVAMYTYNSVEGVYFNDNPSGYLGAY